MLGSAGAQITSLWNKDLVNPVLTDQGEQDAIEINEWIQKYSDPETDPADAAIHEQVSQFVRKALAGRATWTTSNLRRAMDTLLWAFGYDQNSRRGWTTAEVHQHSIFAQMLKKIENVFESDGHRANRGTNFLLTKITQ